MHWDWCRLWQYQSWSFQERDTKLEIFLIYTNSQNLIISMEYMLIFNQKPFSFCIPSLKTPQPVLPWFRVSFLLTLILTLFVAFLHFLWLQLIFEIIVYWTQLSDWYATQSSPLERSSWCFLNNSLVYFNPKKYT